MTKKIKASDNKILEQIEELYFYTQYGKLMPGFIHNINGKLTALDSKIQLSAMKIKFKNKKLAGKEEELGENVVTALRKEYDELEIVFDELNKSKTLLNNLLSILNEKVASENIFKSKLLDINALIKDFHEYFMFYKRYKHNCDIIFELDANPFIKMESKDINFLLYVIVRNGVDAGFENEDSKSYIKYTTKNYDDFVLLQIYNKGKICDENERLFVDVFTTKENYGKEGVSFDMPVGHGTDLYFLGKILAKYPNLSYEYLPDYDNNSSVFSFKLPKK